MREVIFETDDLDLAGRKEDEFILQFDSIENGYNKHRGGAIGRTGLPLDDDHRLKIGEGKKRWYETPNGQEQIRFLQSRKGIPTGPTGKPAWNTGITMPPRPEEWCQNISNATRGKPKPEGFGAKISAAKKGKPLTEKQLAGHKKAGETLKGHSAYPNQQKAVRETMQKEWVVTTPTGETLEVTNLREWCKERDLNSCELPRNGHRGYRARLKQ